MFRNIGSSFRGFLKKNSRVIAAAALSVIMVATALLLSAMVNTVEIRIDEKRFTFYSTQSNPRKIVAAAGIDLEKEDLIYVDRSGSKPVLTVKKAVPVYIVSGEYSATLKLAGGTVQDALATSGLSLGENDTLNYDLNDSIKGNMVIQLSRVEYVTETVTEEIPYEVKTVNSAALAKGQQTVSGGQNGVKEVTYSRKKVDGTVVESTAVSENIISQPVAQVVTVGTKATVAAAAASSAKVSGGVISELTPDREITLDENGRPTNYSKVITGKATAYYNTYNRRCATGVWPKPGYIAVNPKQIPYGTRLYIVSADGKFNYGFAIAADTGGFTSNGSGTVADLFFNTKGECISFGRRQINIYVLD